MGDNIGESGPSSSEAQEGKSQGVIRKLDEVVINRIAAGEVVQRPANALKELLENSLDAGAKSIQIVVKAGGLKLLQIQDDGSGIKKEDLPIVCQRFTTSKLECFEDLQKIQTYGFRGEALASISHVGHLAIVTKTSESVCAFRAEYTNGELKPSTSAAPNPKACAGNVGTIIMVEDLFFNMETRRRALKSTADEHNKIVDVVTKYAIHNCRVGFSLKKFGENTNDVRVPANSSHLDNIKMLYGLQIARELVPVSAEDNVTKFRMHGYVSNVNYSLKKASLLLFINNRLVDSLALRRAIDTVYSSYLPKGSHPFLYLSIKIDPRNVDVNVHPTKHEVHFLHEEMIINSIRNSIENVVLTTNQSRTFYVQSLLPNVTTSSSNTAEETSRKRKEKHVPGNDPSFNANESSVSAKNMVRTDPKIQKLDKFLSSTSNANQSLTGHNSSLDESSSLLNCSTSTHYSDIDDIVQSIAATPSQSKTSISALVDKERSVPSLIPQDDVGVSSQSSTISSDGAKRREIRLRSVKNLRKKTEDNCHNGLLELFRNHIFVGCVDRTLALVQHETKLCMTNTYRLSVELFYQKMVQEFGNFGLISFDEPVYIRELVRAAFETLQPGQVINGLTEEEMNNSAQVEDEVHNLLVSKARMLGDYFALKVDVDGKLLSIPMLLENYFPNLDEIPMYLINLTKKVNWTSEQECFDTFSLQTAIFYAVKPGSSEDNEEVTMNNHSWKWTIEHVLYPEIMKSLLPPKTFANDSTVIQLANLPDLYKVFERC